MDYAFPTKNATRTTGVACGSGVANSDPAQTQWSAARYANFCPLPADGNLKWSMFVQVVVETMSNVAIGYSTSSGMSKAEGFLLLLENLRREQVRIRVRAHKRGVPSLILWKREGTVGERRGKNRDHRRRSAVSAL